jgi:septum formation protein
MNKRFVLASSSPRRKELFKFIIEAFDILSMNVDETTEKTDPLEIVLELADKKANATAEQCGDDAVILGADTVVVFGDVVLGKPEDKKDAVRMLKMLSGKSHYVYTGFCIIDKSSGKTVLDYEKTKVNFNKMTEKEIVDYVDSAEPMDKAGAYGIQGLGGKFISGIQGCYFCVMGFPMSKIYDAFKELKLV